MLVEERSLLQRGGTPQAADASEPPLERGGRYEDELEKRGGEWLIARRVRSE